MNGFKWAANPIKLDRAIKLCGEGASEEMIKERYIKLAGLVLSVEEAKKVEEKKEEVKVKKSKKNV